MNIRLFAIIATITAALLPQAAGAADIGIDIRFSTNEAAIIRAYYEEHRPARPGKKAGNRALPPGIAKNLARGKPLPPGIAKQSLPADLAVLLPPVRGGYERVLIDGKVLLVEVATQVIHDVLKDIILK